tara:strand:+ start:5297 stop:6175 length:879 start_codon:yes stop_codon:yes gene_type:complete
MSRPSFLIIGFGGYIASRHLSAIKDIDGEIKGVIDIEFDDRLLKDLPENIIKANNIEDFFEEYQNEIDFLVVCSPNFLHVEHIIKGLERNMNIISEKPLALDTKGLESIRKAEDVSNGKVNGILQLRLHPVVAQLQELVKKLDKDNHEINLVFVAKRDDEYFESWKGNLSLSGGILLNLGVHYFDLVLNIFGEFSDIFLEDHSIKRSKGYVKLKKGIVNWLFSFEQEDINSFVSENDSVHRSISVDGNEIEFSKVEEDLHTLSYKMILSGKGFSIKDASNSIELIDKINQIR